MSSHHNMRTFYTLVLTQTLSLIGSRISGLAIGIHIFTETGSATPLALVAFFGIVPLILAASVSGVLADRWDRRAVMILSDAGQALGTVLLLISFAGGGFELWHLYLVTFIQAIFGVFQGPAFSASVTMLVPEAQRERANAIQQMTGPTAGIVAPALAGVIYALGGVVGAILVVFGWAWGARTVRSMALSIREREFINTSRFSGSNSFEIIFNEIFPYVYAYMVVSFINSILFVINTEAALAVIGLSKVEVPTLGSIIFWALSYNAMFTGQYTWVVAPVVATIILFLGLFLTSTGYNQMYATRRGHS